MPKLLNSVTLETYSYKTEEEKAELILEMERKGWTLVTDRIEIEGEVNFAKMTEHYPEDNLGHFSTSRMHWQKVC